MLLALVWRWPVALCQQLFGNGFKSIGAEDEGSYQGGLAVASVADHGNDVLPLNLGPNICLKYFETIKEMLWVELVISDVFSRDNFQVKLQVFNFTGILPSQNI